MMPRNTNNLLFNITRFLNFVHCLLLKKDSELNREQLFMSDPAEYVAHPLSWRWDRIKFPKRSVVLFLNTDDFKTHKPRGPKSNLPSS
jgi:hypothetical protein